jgi:hypothetical protein
MVSYAKGRAFEIKMLWKLFTDFEGEEGGFMYDKVSSTKRKTDICIGF